ncbi:hypothetical protein PF66_00512 [Pseudomonas asplenii]|uniref:Uncharacterized protein n=1 Tax=Pseudomonas asplenii TaxID=53407 RepID=A0A0N0VKT6_9PSED|nr:hypothetical protein PF66_00512 [Pseudomonas fuscovaginae]KPA94281.1 hypothetical protein PF70_05769 [Pseudomonas fuscovaginae]
MGVRFPRGNSVACERARAVVSVWREVDREEGNQKNGQA